MISPEAALTVATYAGMVVLGSAVVAAFDEDGRTILAEASVKVGAVLLALPFLGAFWWLRENDYHLFSELHCDLSNEAWRLSSVPSITFLKPLLLDIIVVVGGFLLKIIIVLGAAASAVAGVVFAVMALPHLVHLVIHAIRLTAEGIHEAVHRIYRAARAVVFFFMQPPSLRSLKEVFRARRLNPEKAAEAARRLQEEVDAMRRDRRASAVRARAYAYHYRNFVRHIRKLARFMSARRARAYTEYNETVADMADELTDAVEATFHGTNRRNRRDGKD